MNQRQKRARDRRRAGQDVSRSFFGTGSFVSSNRRGDEAIVKMPQKATGDVQDEQVTGLAKASPFFRKLEEEPVVPETKEEEKRIIASAVEEDEDDEDEE